MGKDNTNAGTERSKHQGLLQVSRDQQELILLLATKAAGGSLRGTRGKRE